MSTADGRARVCRDGMTFGSMPFETETTDVRGVIASRADAMVTVRGTCEEMCPAREREARAASGEVHALERGAGTSVVKRYRRTVRSGSDDAENVRTIGALERSVDRVLDAVARVARGEESACAMSSSRAFADDRLRAVRQDLSIQGIFAEDPDACARAGALLERMVAYAVVSERERRSGLNGACDFGEARLRDEQLGKTFGMLFSVFRELGADRVDPRRVGRAFSLFACSTARDAPVSSSASVSSSSELAGDLRRVGDEALSTSDARFGLQCLHALLEGNTQRVFKLVESAECSYELACCLERHFPVLRVEALRAMNASMNATPMSLDELARVLRFDDARDAETYAKACGLSVDDETRSVSFRTLPFTYPNLRHPDVAEKLRAPSSLVDAKRVPPTDEHPPRDISIHLASLTVKTSETPTR